MPVTVVQTVSIMVPSLAGVTFIGYKTPDWSRGLGVGLSTWTPTIVINTKDAGTAGAGKGTPMPITLSPTLRSNLVSSFRGQGLIGTSMPIFVTALASGLRALYLQTVTNTIHTGVAVGTGVATFVPTAAVSHLVRGFTSVGMTGEGPTKMASAIASGLETTFRAMTLTQPIVGPANSSTAVGTGTGSIV